MSETIALLPVLAVWLGMALFVARGGSVKVHDKKHTAFFSALSAGGLAQVAGPPRTRPHLLSFLKRLQAGG